VARAYAILQTHQPLADKLRPQGDRAAKNLPMPSAPVLPRGSSSVCAPHSWVPNLPSMLCCTRLWMAVLLGTAILGPFPGCGGRRLSSGTVIEEGAPTWTKIRPENEQMRHGIANAPLTVDLEASQDAAIDAARHDLCLHLRRWLLLHTVLPSGQNADGENMGWEATDWGVFEETLPDVTVEALFVDHQFGHVWAHVTLPLERLKTHLKLREARVLAEATQHMNAADMARRTRGWSEVLRELTIAFAVASGPEGLRVESRSGDLLRVETTRRLQRLVERLEVRRLIGIDAARSGRQRDAFLMVQARHRQTRMGLGGIPIVFSFEEGGGSLSAVPLTAESGRTRAEITYLRGRTNPTVVEATLDLARLLMLSGRPPLPEETLALITLPRAYFPIELSAPRVVLMQVARGGAYQDAQLLTDLTQILEEGGAMVTQPTVDMLSNPIIFTQVERGENPGDVDQIDLVGVIVLDLEDVQGKRGRRGGVRYGAGHALFRLFDLNLDELVGDIQIEGESAGFSNADVQQSFFRQAAQDLKVRVEATLQGASAEGSQR